MPRARVLVVAAVSALAIAASLPAAAGAWEPAATATVHPGVQTYTQGAQCTANFIFTSGTRVFIGQAAHCSGTGAATDTNGCTAASLPIGTEVEVTGASKPGRMVYNSWLTMPSPGETNADACAYNDLALVDLDPADYAKVNPSIPTYGGPVGISDGTVQGDRVYSYGNSELRGGVTTLSPKTGVSLGDEGNGWTHVVYTASPGVPGDSGSGFLDAEGRAVGTLSTVALAPLAGSNGLGNLARELDFARRHSGIGGLRLVPGNQPFSALP